jgi:hypothetical protein
MTGAPKRRPPCSFETAVAAQLCLPGSTERGQEIQSSHTEDTGPNRPSFSNAGLALMGSTKILELHARGNQDEAGDFQSLRPIT